jgi:hypothetical protein
VPAAAAAQPFGDAVSAIGSSATGTAASHTTGTAGGTSTTNGMGGFLSGLDATVPVGANAPVYSVPVEVLADAMADATNVSDYHVGESDPAVNLDVSGDNVKGLGITQMPKLPELSEPSRSNMPALPGLNGFGQVTGLIGGLLGGGALPAGGAGNLTGALPLGGGLTGNLPGGVPAANLPGTAPAAAVPGLDLVGAVPGLAGGFTGQLPGAPKLPGLPNVPGTGSAPRTGTPNLPVPGLTDVGGLQQVTALVGSLFDGATPQVPGLGHAPGLPQVPAVSHLSDTQLLQLPELGKAPVRTPALSGLDSTKVLNTNEVAGSSTLADTRSKLAGLLDHHTI